MAKRILIIILLIIALINVLNLTDLDDHLYYRISNWMTRDKTGKIWLPDYRLSREPKILSCVKSNLSGIAFNPITGTLFAITNNPERIIEVTTNGRCLRTIKLHRLRDTEGITYLYDQYFAILEERDRTLHIIRILDDTRKIKKEQIIQSISLDLDRNDNRGFEGVAYDSKEHVFYVVKEKSPMRFYKIEGLLNKKKIVVSTQKKITSFNLLFIMDDFSGLHFDPETNHFLVLSHESRLAAEVSLKGKRVSYMDLETGFSGLKRDIPQAEGITMDDQRNIYIVSEPNLLYTYSKN